MSAATHESMMALCIELAQEGAGFVEPNPMVGAVVVRDGVILGRGYHEQLGHGHGEFNALQNAGESARGADLYVTLEPCSTSGRTGPCSQAIIDSGIKRVFIGAIDPNPNHEGRAIALLRSAGIEVSQGILEDHCLELIASFRRFLLRPTPVVVAKWASTLDGKIATKTGDSKWITSKEARISVHEERARSDAILVGIGTILADDPALTVRHVAGQSPQPVIVDSHLRTPIDAQIIAASDHKPWLYCLAGTDAAKMAEFESLGCLVVQCGTQNGRVDLSAVLRDLKSRGMGRVMVEGGATILGSFLDQHLVDLVQAFVAPRILGDEQGRSAVKGRSIDAIAKTIDLEWLHVDFCGPDLRLIGRVLE